MRSGSAVSASSFIAGLVAGESPGPLRRGTGAWSGPVEDLRLLRTARWARESSVSPGDDGSGAVVWLLRWGDEFAADRTCQLRRHSLSLSLRGPASGSRQHSLVPQAAPAGSGADVHAGTAALR